MKDVSEVTWHWPELFQFQAPRQVAVYDIWDRIEHTGSED